MFPKYFRKKKRKGPRGETLPEDRKGLPDSELPAGLCPRCHTKSSFQVIGSLPLTFDHEQVILERTGQQTADHFERASVLVCRHCEQGVVVVEEKLIGGKRHPESKGGTISWRGVYWWPLPDADLSDDVPSTISEVFREAVKSLAADCPRSAVVMARRTLEAIASDKGETTGTLAQRLDRLSEKGALHPTLAEWATEVRVIGNLGAHFDPVNAVSRTDAEQLLAFLRELIKFLYELPAELQRRRNP